MNKWLFRGLALCLALCLTLAACFAFAEGLDDEACGLGEAVSAAQSHEGVTPEQHVAGVKTEREILAAQSAPAQVEAVSAPVSAPEAEAAVLPASDYANEKSTRGFVYRMYKIVLGREPDPNGFNMWVTALDNGDKSAADIVYGFFNSPEYKGKNKSADAMVTDCYRAMMNREPDPAGKANWVNRLTVGMTNQAILYGFVCSNEFTNLAAYFGIERGNLALTDPRDLNYERTYFVYRLYKNCLGRNPDPVGLRNWCEVLANGGSGTHVAYGFVFSKEYQNKHVGNQAYAEMLYRTILGRNPDSAGLNNWTSQLNYSHTREHVLNGFMFSPEFKGHCARAGITLGSKVFEADASTSWQYNIAVLNLANKDRAAQGLPMLTTRSDLWINVAQVRAEEVEDYFSHTRPDGSSWTTAFEQAGFDYWFAGENIAYGYGTPQSVYTAWMNSPGHRANLLDKNFEQMATAYYWGDRKNWAQSFYTPYNVTK